MGDCMILIRCLLLTFLYATTLQGMQEECGICYEKNEHFFRLNCCDNTKKICHDCDNQLLHVGRSNDWDCPYCRRVCVFSHARNSKEYFKTLSADPQLTKRYQSRPSDFQLKLLTRYGLAQRFALFFQLKSIAPIVSATSSIAAITKIYRCRSRNSQLISLQSALKKSKDQLLSFDFEQFDPVIAHNPLTHARSIKHWYSDVQDTTLRNRLALAIAEYECAYSAAYTKIIASYYYRPASDFQEHESQLVANLEHAATDVEALLIECTKKNALLPIDYCLITGAVVIAAISGYVATISHAKMVDLLGDLL